jgi:hypothetical protein
MKFDIDKLNRAELLELNRRIIERLKYLSKKEAVEYSRKFSVGDVVEFNNEGTIIHGTVIRINRKTLSIKTREGQWNVPPQFLRKAGKTEKGKQLEIVK